MIQAAVFVASFVLAIEGRAQRPSQLPPPDSSRPPVLTRLAADSIRRQVVQLQLYQLVGNLQRADATALDADLSGVQWGPADEASRRQTQCASVSAAIALVAGRLASPSASVGGTPLVPIFLANPRVADSAGAIAVSSDLIIVLPLSGKDSARVVQILDPEHVRWSRIDGLLAFLCRVATRVSQP